MTTNLPNLASDFDSRSDIWIGVIGFCYRLAGMAEYHLCRFQIAESPDIRGGQLAQLIRCPFWQIVGNTSAFDGSAIGHGCVTVPGGPFGVPLLWLAARHIAA